MATRRFRLLQNCSKNTFPNSSRRCTSVAKRGSKSATSVYIQKLEPKLLGLKAAMGTSFDATNVHHMEKSVDQIDELNHEIKSLWHSVVDSHESKVNHLHDQLQGKIKANKRAEEQIQDLEEQLEQYKSENMEMDGTDNVINAELADIKQERDSLNESLDEQLTINQEMQKTNDLMEKQLQLLQSQLTALRVEMDEKEENINDSRSGRVTTDDKMDVSEEIAKTKSNMAELLRDLIEVEQQNNKFKMLCAALAGTTILVVGYSVQRNRQIAKLKQEYDELVTKIEDFINFKI